MAAVNYGSLPFTEAVDFFRGKLNTPTERWTDIWQGAHTKAFVVAGAMQHDLLADLRSAVDAAIADGKSLTAFKSEFNNIVAKHGWDHTGGASWRANIIYKTNMRQAHNAGRWQQLQNSDYWQYKHGDSANPRPHHLSWHNTLLPKDHPWWRTHFPQNGWGCSCRVTGMSKATAKRRGLKVSSAPSDGVRDWIDKNTGEVHQVPNGIDPGFAYSVGEAHVGRQLSHSQMAKWQAQKGDVWETLTTGSWRSAGLQEKLPLLKSDTPLVSSAKTADQVKATLVDTFGDETILPGPGNNLAVYVNSASLAEHLEPSRARFIPLLPEIIASPQEVWAAFERHKGTGKVELKHRYIKMVKSGNYKGQLLIAQVVKGVLEAWTFVPVKSEIYVNKQRRGLLLWSDETVGE